MMFSFHMMDYPIQLEETGKVGYWATWYDFHYPYCNTGFFKNEVLSYSKLWYFGPL